ncbi:MULTISPECIES: phage baseplate assembly protein V [Okeania]|uniref:Phage tail protein n=1 Tax=Okeania hirsuta TaxID=1458930 RepID=A0A3N6PGP9_9CYAN|nr:MULTISPECIES: phage baseplate assembly protein V [Okeania]NEP07965.1 phage tail protein [Okeania sp. SIO4D6]NEP73694.1 phage tail protein [Okeania sp. SIO2G5]NEP94486.1 phage tail protein [Okeania sp. SIO2F5]NEQ92117.1 phage tail protein [Okeania sp. SIO2G4]NES88024.1 phage tail protein [Okeania sp. SIO2B9]
MRLFDLLMDNEEREAIASRIYGVVVGVVTNNEDPEGLGRVKVKFPWLSDEDESDWARIAAPMAGNERGIYFLPEVDDEVLVVFEHGDVRFPYIIGFLWNGQEPPPTTNEDGQNNIRLIKSRSGHVIRLNDEEGKETIEIVDKTEKNSIVFDTASNTIAISSDGDITLSATQGNIKLEAQNIEIKSTADTKIESDAGMNLEASSTMNLKGQTINLN